MNLTQTPTPGPVTATHAQWIIVLLVAILFVQIIAIALGIY